MKTDTLHPKLFFLGRLLIGGIFIYSGVSNLLDINSTLGYAASKSMTGIFSILVILSQIVLILAGLSFITAIHPKLGAYATILFLVPVTLVMHNFWASTGMERIVELHSFQGNISLLGATLMFLVIPEPWHYSLHDRFVGLLSRSNKPSNLPNANK